jgi:hypothetical protein
MKWIEIKKAKPKFSQLYLLATDPTPVLVTLAASTTTPEGVMHQFKDASGSVYGSADSYAGTHIAAVNAPEKEVQE